MAYLPPPARVDDLLGFADAVRQWISDAAPLFEPFQFDARLSSSSSSTPQNTLVLAVHQAATSLLQVGRVDPKVLPAAQVAYQTLAESGKSMRTTKVDRHPDTVLRRLPMLHTHALVHYLQEVLAVPHVLASGILQLMYHADRDALVAGAAAPACPMCHARRFATSDYLWASQVLDLLCSPWNMFCISEKNVHQVALVNVDAARALWAPESALWLQKHSFMLLTTVLEKANKHAVPSADVADIVSGIVHCLTEEGLVELIRNMPRYKLADGPTPWRSLLAQFLTRRTSPMLAKQWEHVFSVWPNLPGVHYSAVLQALGNIMSNHSESEDGMYTIASLRSPRQYLHQ
jgi:hypothetical protein